MNIAVDVMGGDRAPVEILAGALSAAARFPEHRFLLVGSEETLSAAALPANTEAVLSKTVMAMDEPVDNLRRKKDSSIFVATNLVREKRADAVVSAGSTGAQMASALLLCGRVGKIKRPAIATPYPTLEGDKLMLDSGANPEADAQNLVDFAALGNFYAREFLGVANPRLALLSNGAESHKGTATVVAAHKLLSARSDLNFIGNLEGRDLMRGGFDVLITDGFSGNVVLKTTEGVASALMKLIKQELTATTVRKLGAALVKPGLMALKERFDYSSYGGAPLLGVGGVSIICHGSSDRIAIENAIVRALECAQNDFVNKLKASLERAEFIEEGKE